jgi:hypothetical protein
VKRFNLHVIGDPEEWRESLLFKKIRTPQLGDFIDKDGYIF